MKKFLNIFLVVIITTGIYCAQAQKPLPPDYHFHGEGIPQDYGQDALTDITVYWFPEDTTCMLSIAPDPFILEITSIEFINEDTVNARSFKPPVEGTRLIIPTAYMHNIFIKTKMGITSVSFQGFKELGSRVALINGKVAYSMLDVDRSILPLREEFKNGDGEAFKYSNWEWNPIYDQWVIRQRNSNSNRISMKKKNLSY